MHVDLVVSSPVQGLTTETLSSVRALEVLAFGRMRTSEVAHHMGVHPRTVRRVLGQLEQRGWVHRVAGRIPQWELSVRILSLATRAAFETSALSDQAAINLVDDLCAETGRPVYAVIPCYDAVCCVADSRHDVLLERGALAPAVENVGGHVLMAHREPWRAQNLALANASPRDWQPRFDAIRDSGYATTVTRGRIELAFPLGWRDDPAMVAIVVGNVAASEVDATVERVATLLSHLERHVACPVARPAIST